MSYALARKLQGTGGQALLRRRGLSAVQRCAVVNVDLPRNPAVLEQRITGHHMGQRRYRHIYLLVAGGTTEERMLTTFSLKDLALVALDPLSRIEELKRKMEALVGFKPPAPADLSETLRVDSEAAQRERRKSVALAGGELLAAAFAFVRQALQGRDATLPDGRKMACGKCRCVFGTTPPPRRRQAFLPESALEPSSRSKAQ
jgi:hypothetical protein